MTQLTLGKTIWRSTDRAPPKCDFDGVVTDAINDFVWRIRQVRRGRGNLTLGE